MALNGSVELRAVDNCGSRQTRAILSMEKGKWQHGNNERTIILVYNEGLWERMSRLMVANIKV